MSKILLKNLNKYFGDLKAVDCINLEINEKEFITLLGPSGCGKTTTLRCIAGLEEPNSGEIYIDDHCVYSSEKRINVLPGRRKLGLVFQNYALWPHMTVGQNISFGLGRENLQKAALEERVMEILRIVGLEGHAERYPHELSGGQQQRVAVARMVVTEPKIFLFDEPLSNLDAKLRMKLRSELKRLHLDLGATTVYVTHDQIEAMALSDKIVVMKEGVVQQVGAPYEIYHFPSNLFIADFMGNPQTNLLKGTVRRQNGKTAIAFKEFTDLTIVLEVGNDLAEGHEVIVNIRPEDIEISRNSNDQWLACNVYTTQPMGSEILVHLKSKRSNIDIVAKNVEEECLDLKTEMTVSIKPKRGNVYDEKTGNLILSFGMAGEGGGVKPTRGGSVG